MRRLAAFVICSLSVAIACAQIVLLGEQSSRRLEIRVLSSRPDLVTGGDALIEVSVGAQPSTIRVTAAGRDVTNVFRQTRPGRFVGLVEGLAEGKVRVRAFSGGARAEVVLTNHRRVGPVLSGPHLTPYKCTTEEVGLGPPLDAHCSARTRVEFFYKTASGTDFRPLPDVGARPDDLATTTVEGRTVPYIVRLEWGTMNRGIYWIATLDDPRNGPGVDWVPGLSWNGRAVVQFGGGTGTKYSQGTTLLPTQVLQVGGWLLSRGFAFLMSSQNLPFIHSNDALSGESVMMMKEYFIERYAVPAWMVGVGASSGTMFQLLIAQNFPGLLDGLLLEGAYPDQLSVWADVTDCHLLRNYFDSRAGWTPDQQQAVEGSTTGTCTAWAPFAKFVLATNAPDCAIASELVYHPVFNRAGARCTIFDINVNSYGRDPSTGAARRPLDNGGVEYGRQALIDRIITPRQFIELNRGIGGYDEDGQIRAARSSASAEAISLAYATGRINSGFGSLNAIPILQYRRYADPRGDIHDRLRDFAIRDRLARANGRFDNHVIWVSGAASPGLSTTALSTMTEWLDAVVSDTTQDPLRVKVVRAKPAAAVDACWDQSTRIDDRDNQCRSLYPPHGNPRVAAGGPVSGLVLKCQRKQLRRGDYADISFDDDEWRQLLSVFPDGVCDYSKPGVGQAPPAGTFLKLPLAAAR